MTTRLKKHSKQKYTTITITLLALFSTITIYTTFKNDTSVSIDLDAQETLNIAYLNQNAKFNMPERRFRNIMHQMTHQKVKAPLKYGSVQMESKNIEALFIILNQNNYKHKDIYIEILTK